MSVAARTKVVVLRGHLTNPWDLQSWQHLGSRFDVVTPVTRSGVFDVRRLPVEQVKVRAVRDFLPRGTVGDVLVAVAGDRYLDLDEALADADIVHAAELSFWFTAEAARLKERHGYKLVLTVWETLPLLSTFRNRWARAYRNRVLDAGDLFLAATERAREALLLEGVAPGRIEVSYPGIDLQRFGAATVSAPPTEHVLISPGRLVWEKGHQDVMRALAALRRGIVQAPAGVEPPRLLLVGSGPEEQRLRAYAKELGLGAGVEFRSVSYEEMPALYARASCMVLASLSNAGGMRYLGDVPHFFWEEQFGLVLAEAMAAGLPIVASSSGAIPEVVGPSGVYFVPGDWIGLAKRLAEGPLARPPGERVAHPDELVQRYSTEAASERLTAVYDRLLGANASS